MSSRQKNKMKRKRRARLARAERRRERAMRKFRRECEREYEIYARRRNRWYRRLLRWLTGGCFG